MKKNAFVFFTFVMMGTANIFSQNQQSIIVKFKSASRPIKKNISGNEAFQIPKLDILNKKNGLESVTLTGNKKQNNTYVINLSSKDEINELIKTYKNTDLFEYVEPNFIGRAHGYVQTTPNDTHYDRQWCHYNDGSFSLSTAKEDADMDTDIAWDITKGNKDIIVAVLDTGLRLNHPEFRNRIWVNPNETENGRDSDSNGYVDDFNGGWDFVNNDNDPTDDQGHGTHVTGIALARGNNRDGYAGVNWKSQIMVCKVLDSRNRGSYSNWADAMYYAVDNGASVINLSAGGTGASSILEEAVNYAYENNVIVVASSGNSNRAIDYPARYENAFAIGSTNPDDTRSAPFPGGFSNGSNYGPELDFVAPGANIYGLDERSDTNYDVLMSGTSMASPQVTGLISLLLSINPDLTANEIRSILEETSEDEVGDAEDTQGWDQYFGHGRINVHQALLTQSNLGVDRNDTALESNLKIIPNPVSSTMTTRIVGSQNGNYMVEVYNYLGQLVSTKNNIDRNAEIELSVMKSGVYLLKIKNTENLSSTTKQLIVK